MCRSSEKRSAFYGLDRMRRIIVLITANFAVNKYRVTMLIEGHNENINPKLFLGYMEKPHLSFGFIKFRS